MKEYRSLSQEEKQIIVDLYYRNLSYHEIKNSFNCSIRCIRSTLKEAGINTLQKERYVLNHDYFREINDEHKAYWLGLLYADGAMVRGNTVTITLKNEDAYLLETFRLDLGLTKQVRYYTRDNGYSKNFEAATLSFASKQIYSDLQNLGMLPNKMATRNKLPDINLDLMRHFVRGYFDGDGSISNANSINIVKGIMYSYPKKVFAVIATEPMCRELAGFLNLVTYGIKDSRTEAMKYLTTKSNSQIKTIADCFYQDATIFMTRKKEMFFN